MYRHNWKNCFIAVFVSFSAISCLLPPVRSQAAEPAPQLRKTHLYFFNSPLRYEKTPGRYEAGYGVHPVFDEVRNYPELFERVQDLVEVNPDLEGVLAFDGILSEREEPADGQAEKVLEVRGKVFTEEQKPLLRQVILDVMQDDPDWQPLVDNIVIDLEKMPAVRPSPELAQQFYALGLNAFWDCELVTADFAFMRAYSEGPDLEFLLYWRVVTAIAMDEYGRASQKLRFLLRQNPAGSRSPTIAREFERLQGPLRWKLQELEQDVLLTLLPESIPSNAGINEQ